MPSIAVIIPVYNHGKYLSDCLASISSQAEITEIIVVDDGSTDDSYEIARHHALTDSRIIVLTHDNHINLGVSASRNLAIRHAKSEWIAFCDADDYYLAGRFDAFLQLEKSGIDGTYEDVLSGGDDDDEILGHRITGITDQVAPEELFEHLLSHRDQSISIIGMIIRRAALLDIGLFDTELSIGEDTDIIWRLAQCYNLAQLHTSDAKVIRRVHAHNTYQNQQKLIAGRLAFYKKWKGLNPHSRIEKAYQYYQYQNELLRSNNPFRRCWAWLRFQSGKLL